MIRIIVCEPQKAPRVDRINGTLQEMQHIVGGLIEAVYPPQHDDNTAIICNDEGKLGGYEINRALTTEDGIPYDVIYGTFFISATDDEGEDIDLTDAQIEKYMALYKDYLPADYAESRADICSPRMEFWF